ncbi:hypothetical protein DL96DRAFT_1605033 [Flagelloscypha sp. PMI_526]|nr:hypothetical protein DL96DRAFT_1605033 [Flagelloscypha sp. PMI_526]
MNSPRVSVELPIGPARLFCAAEPNQITPTTVSPFDASFGYTLSRQSTNESRHDASSSRLSYSPPGDGDDLPSYSEDASPPTYSLKDKQPTLAEYLFKFGFIFFPFWILGACILCSPLQTPSSSDSDSTAWLPHKTDAERQVIVSRIRALELKWAKRCLYACIAFFGLVPVVAVLIWQLTASSSS